jgi:uncharacterized repeat protein (TIGR03803 family)
MGMKSLGLTGYALAIGGAAAMLAGCGGSQSSPITPRAPLSEHAARPVAAYSSLYSFQAEPDGQNPEARLIPFNGSLYGTTLVGGAGCVGKGCGIVFTVTTSGAETVLHRFKGRPDGSKPLAELVAVKQELYATTYNGGVACKAAKIIGCGVVFSVAPSGTENVVYRFQGIPDGAFPEGPLTLVNGILYGTTSGGGTECADVQDGCGAVYSIDASGNERVLYRFKGKPDGAVPTGNLVFLNGTLYGTTSYGGANGEGAVFAITTSGSERVLYSSAGNYDMVRPSGLVVMGGAIYGSSPFGGKLSGGTVYEITTGGDEHIVHGFNPNNEFNGSRPSGRLIAVNGLLYGTTEYGGRTHGGYGLVYSLSSSGDLRVLHRFDEGSPDGAYPLAGVSDAKGTLYGTTAFGGAGCHYSCQSGYGTVFRLVR